MGSANITFEQIPDSLVLPGTYGEFNLKARKLSLPENDQEILILAQGLASGSVAELTPTDVYSDAEALAYFGAGSQAHLMVRAVLDANPRAKIKVCTVDDAAGGVAAAGKFAIAGTATAAGALTVYIGNERITIAVAKGIAAAAVATALQTAIADKEPYLPVTSAVNVADVDLTARNKGTLGNQVRLGKVNGVAGITVTITDMASGATDPDIGAVSGLLDTVHPDDCYIYCPAWNDDDNLGDLKTHINEISGPLEQRPAICVAAATDLTDTLSNIKIKCGTTLNHWRTSMAYIEGSRNSPFEIAAAYAGAIASKDDPAANLDNVILPKIHAPVTSDWLSETQKSDLIKSGVTPLHVIPGNNVAICMAVTTYTTNDQGVSDTGLRDLSKPRIADYARATVLARISTKFAQAKNLQRVKKGIREEVIDAFYQLEAAEIVENVAAWEDYILVEDDLVNDGRVNVKIATDAVAPLHIVALRFDLL